MNDYKRFVSYIYNYEMKIKKNNVGYVRVEVKDNQCKITIHMQVKSIVNGKLTIYGFLRDEVNLVGIPLGEFTLKNGSGESQIFMQTNRIGEAGHDFSEIGGIILFISQDKYFGTEWDDKPLVFQQFREEEIKEEEEVIVETAELKYEERAEEVPQDITYEDMTNENMMSENIINENITNQNITNENITNENITNENITNENITNQNITNQNVTNENITNQNITNENIMFQEMPSYKCNPCFQVYTLAELYDRFAYSVKDDFMLHGYHRFGHLGVLEKNNRYILGVPGIFCRWEEQIANNYGFHNFISKSSKALKYGDFGYWYSSTEYLK